MSTTRDLILARLSTTRMGLDEVLQHLDPGMMTWAPRKGMRTVAGQLVEIAATEVQILARLRDDQWISDDEVRDRIGAHEDFDRLKEFLAEVRGKTLAYIEGLSHAELDESVPIKGWHESIGLPETPRSEVFASICQHEAYHTGQLVSYLWAHGDNPYEW
ncbi:MAG: DinB family protein [Fimbriimonas sp.]